MRIIYVGYVSVTLYMNRPMYVSLCLYIYRLHVHVPACSVMFKFKDELHQSSLFDIESFKLA